MCCLLSCSNPNQYMQEKKFQNNKSEVNQTNMVNFNINTSSMWWILFLKLPLYENVIDCNLVCINVMYAGF
jgi:hypothetical protein